MIVHSWADVGLLVLSALVAGFGFAAGQKLFSRLFG
jgi:hypothetical protein